jgi:hypothetical protein
VRRGPIRILPALVAIAAFAAHVTAAGPTPSAAARPPVLERFLALDDPNPTQFRALRHLEAQNDKFGIRAWMDAWTEVGPSGFTYRIVAEEGSDWIRSRVFRESLEAEQRLWASDAPNRASFTPANYIFEDRGEADGLASVVVKPRRRDMLLIEGSIFLRSADGELMRMEGDLAKSPSFWTPRVRVVREFQRIAGIRLPVLLEAVANIRFVGPSTFRAVYEYETVNRQRVGTPQLRAAASR